MASAIKKLKVWQQHPNCENNPTMSQASDMPPTPGPGATVDQKLDFLIAGFTSFRMTLSEVQHHIKNTDKEVNSLKQEVKQLKDIVNKYEQASRNLNVRIIGLPQAASENTPKQVYDRIIRPLLVTAKDAGKINSVPQLSTVVTEAYRMRPKDSGTTSPSRPPHIMVKLSNQTIKSALLSVKKNSMPLPSEEEKAIGIQKFIITEELTRPVFQLLKQLRNDDRVDRAWTIDGKIRFTKKNDDQKKVYKVRSNTDQLDYIIDGNNF